MSKASGKAEFRRIAAELELSIRRGEYPERLDNIRQLMKRFGVAKQTMTNALRLLRQHEFITSHGRSGLRINYDKLNSGVVAIIGRWDDAHYHENCAVMQPLIEDMEKSGFNFVLLRLFSGSMDFLSKLELSNFVGLIFTGYALTENLAAQLTARGIPFVSTTRMPLYPEMDYVNFDTESALNQLAGDLARAGYRRIGLLFPACGSEGYNQVIMKMWKKIKRRLNLDFLSCDRFRHRDDLSWEQNAVNYVKHLAAMPEKPEVLIHYGDYSVHRQQLYKQAAGDYPFGMRLVYVEYEDNSTGVYDPNDIIFANAPSQQLLLPAFTLLVERMRSPEAAFVHRLIPYNINYIQNI